ITQADMDRGGVYNLATAKGEDPRGKEVPVTSKDPNPLDPSDPDYPAEDPDYPGCTDCTVTPLVKDAKLELDKSSKYVDANGDGKVNAGDKIEYSFEVRNVGNVTISNIAITDDQVTVSGGPIDLAPGEKDATTFTAVYTITQADMDRGGVYNLATAKGEDPRGKEVPVTSKDPNPLDPSDPDYPAEDPDYPGCTDCTVTPLVKDA
ncbi:hypothetical protein ORI89_19210, partial [Sphingobacterium sp. UT-1RO-CII-1]|uniref:DUF7507 domain-containing protein n=1 Tax=Sphingobacterium sp. UT-1RO-CII-1 TaxID=2995225 RepID=UPI00227B8334